MLIASLSEVLMKSWVLCISTTCSNLCASVRMNESDKSSFLVFPSWFVFHASLLRRKNYLLYYGNFWCRVKAACFGRIGADELLTSDACSRSRTDPSFRGTQSGFVDKIPNRQFAFEVDMFRSIETAARDVMLTEELLLTETFVDPGTLTSFQCTQGGLVDEVFLDDAESFTFVRNMLQIVMLQHKRWWLLVIVVVVIKTATIVSK